MLRSVETFKALLESESVQNILILPHNMPDGDTLGSAIGMYHLLTHYNKKGYIVLNDDIPSNLLFLFNNEVRCHTTAEVEAIEFDLSVAVDCGETKLFEDRLHLFNRAKHHVNIDHHKTNTNYAQLNIIEPSASSTGEMICMIFTYLGLPYNTRSAEALYAAIVTDTGSFRYSNTRPLTFEICKKLLETSFDFNRLNVEIYQNKSYEKVLLLNKVFETLHLHIEGKCAVIKLTKQMMEMLNLSEYDTDGIVEFVRDIKGIEVVVFVRHIGGSAHKISMRSKYDFDVSAIAQSFKGGGHTKAAGFKSELSIDEIERQVVEAIREALENQG